jgi:hypothetical protein
VQPLPASKETGLPKIQVGEKSWFRQHCASAMSSTIISTQDEAQFTPSGLGGPAPRADHLVSECTVQIRHSLPLYCRTEGSDQLQSCATSRECRTARPKPIERLSNELCEPRRKAIKSKRVTTLIPELSSWIIWSRVNPACSPAMANFLIALTLNWLSRAPFFTEDHTVLEENL